MTFLSAISVRTAIRLRKLLAVVTALALLAASALPEPALADGSTVTLALLYGEPAPADDGPGKILHSCMHCQSHLTASLHVAMPALGSAAIAQTAWDIRDERPHSTRGPPVSPPPKD